MQNATTDHPSRLTTGVPGLDRILCGGLIQGGIYMAVGAPGAGKTIFASQLSFHHVSEGGRAVYVTLLAETHSRLIESMKSLSFWDPDKFSHSLSYMSAYKAIDEKGLDGLLELLRREIRHRDATLLVVDGLVSAAAMARSEVEFKQFIHKLQILSDMLGCTTLLLTSSTEAVVQPEHTMVDGIIELRDIHVNERAIRQIEVRKFRGSEQLRGWHAFTISDSGITIYPRIEAVAKQTLRQFDLNLNEPKLFGVGSLDAAVGGGLPGDSSTLVLGPTGSGKTTLGMHFLIEGARQGEPGLYFGFYEPAELARDHARAIGLDAVTEEKLHFHWELAADDTVDRLANTLLDLVRETGAKRLFIDGLNGFIRAALNEERIPSFIVSLFQMLRAAQVTTIVCQETEDFYGKKVEAPYMAVSAIADNVFVLRRYDIAGRLERGFQVHKMRRSAADNRIFKVTLENAFEIGEPFDRSVTDQ